MIDTALASAVAALAAAVDRQSELTRLLWESIPPGRRAKLLGVHRNTVARRARRKEIEGLLKTTR